MRLGLLGGTFDPIHLGHLRAAETAREGLGLEQIAFVPAHLPPHRPSISSALDRFAMVSLATAGHPHFAPSDIEVRREGLSYTVDTLRALRAARPEDTLVLVLGSDAYAELDTWHQPEAILEACEIAVVARPGAALPAAAQRRIHHIEGPTLPISSTAIRQRVAEGRSIRYLVPEGVADYIEKRRLYR